MESYNGGIGRTSNRAAFNPFQLYTTFGYSIFFKKFFGISADGFFFPGAGIFCGLLFALYIKVKTKFIFEKKVSYLFYTCLALACIATAGTIYIGNTPIHYLNLEKLFPFFFNIFCFNGRFIWWAAALAMPARPRPLSPGPWSAS